MPEHAFDDIKSYVDELRARAAKSQEHAQRTLNPLFKHRGERGDGPDDFEDSSFLYMRGCDADNGSRPIPCPVFWLSPDLRVVPLSNLGTPTRDLQAGDTYRLIATVRNRGDLMVPSAKVEFWLVDPSLGFDIRFATKIGVSAERVQAHGAAEVSLDFTVPPSLSGHRCLFARVFSFSPLDIPVDNYSLNPVIDRHIAQLNLNIVAQASQFQLSWIHHRNAFERLEIVTMDTATLKALRIEAITPIKLVSGARAREFLGLIDIKAVEDNLGKETVKTKRTENGMELVSKDREAVELDHQVDLTKKVQSAIRMLEHDRGDGKAFKKLFAEYRAMTEQSTRTQILLSLPHMGLKEGQGIPLQIVRREVTSKKVLGGIALVVTG